MPTPRQNNSSRVYLTALWAPLGFWLLAAVLFSSWLLALATDAFLLFMVWLWLGALFGVISYFINVWLLQKMSRLVSTMLIVVLNLLFLFLGLFLYIIIAFAVWDGYY